MDQQGTSVFKILGVWLIAVTVVSVFLTGMALILHDANKGQHIYGCAPTASLPSNGRGENPPVKYTPKKGLAL